MFENQEAVTEDFENAWGEAMQLFRDADERPTLILPKKMQEYVESKQAEYMEEDVRVGIIQEWLNHTKEERVCVAMLYEVALGNEGKKPARYESNELHSIMANSITGWKKMENDTGGRARCGGYGTQICYVRDGDGFVELSEDSEIPF